MNKNNSTIVFFLFIVISILSMNLNACFAEDKHKDIFTVHNKIDKYRYYSSPEDSAYINQLPKNYFHLNTEITTNLDPINSQIGDNVQFKTTESLELTDFLTIPANTIISGKITKLLSPKKFIRNSKMIISFDKITCPNGFELELDKNNFTIRPLVIIKGTRYSIANELFYGVIAGGGKYPIGRYINVPVSYAISSGTGLIGGLGYGVMTDDIPKNLGLGFLRGLGAKAIYNFGVETGKSYIISANTPILLTVNATKTENLRYKPEFLNIKQLMLASTFSNNKNIDTELISKTTINNNSSEIIRFYENRYNNAPNNLENQINLGKTYLKAGRIQKAIEFFNKLISKNINNGEIYFYLACAQEEAGNLFEAKDYYLKAIDNNFSESQIYLNIATLYKKLGQPQKAAYYFDKYNNLILATK